MTDEQFWQIIEDAKAKSNGNRNAHLEEMTQTLSALPLQQLVEFEHLFDRKRDAAYRWDIWAAAYLLNGGCSDDGFHYFRAWLISEGKEVYEATIENPDNLATHVNQTANHRYDWELFGCAAWQVYRKRTKEEMPPDEDSPPSPDMGEHWDFDDDEETARRLPELWKGIRHQEDWHNADFSLLMRYHLLNHNDDPPYRGRVTPRSMRLLGVAMARLVWSHLDASQRRVIQFAEKVADGEATPDDIQNALASLDSYPDAPQGPIYSLTNEQRCAYLPLLVGAATPEPRQIGRLIRFFKRGKNARPLPLADMTRDLFGHPFCNAAFDPTWRTETVVNFAKVTERSRKFKDMPILGDALEDAGCNVPEILDHCRADKVHARGCWVLDLILEKE